MKKLLIILGFSLISLSSQADKTCSDLEGDARRLCNDCYEQMTKENIPRKELISINKRFDSRYKICTVAGEQAAEGIRGGDGCYWIGTCKKRAK